MANRDCSIVQVTSHQGLLQGGNITSSLQKISVTEYKNRTRKSYVFLQEQHKYRKTEKTIEGEMLSVNFAADTV